MASFNPNAVSIRAVQPPMLITVMKNLLLYLKRFLKVTLLLNEKCFQMGVIFSSSILLPFFGGFGRISFAGYSRSSFAQVYTAESDVHSSDTPMQPSAYEGMNGASNMG